MNYRDEVYFRSRREAEVPFPPEEFRRRLDGLRRRMQAAGVDMLYLMAPERMYYLSGYQCEWYQAQSPRQWPASSAIAVHTDNDRFILFDSEREAIVGRIFSQPPKIRGSFLAIPCGTAPNSQSASCRRRAGSRGRSAWICEATGPIG